MVRTHKEDHPAGGQRVVAPGSGRARTRKGNRLRSRLLGESIAADMDPMSALTNLMDLMLVFACGLIIALIARYNVNLSVTSDMGPDVQRLDAELEYAEQGIVNGDASFAELGMVYQDLETGDLYVVTQGEPDADE